MKVTSVSHVFDMFLNMYRTTEFKTMKDESTRATYVHSQEFLKLELYNAKGELETHRLREGK